jgi:hypothetical protein
MTKGLFLRHCEQFEESRGNLRRYGGTFSTGPLSPNFLLYFGKFNAALPMYLPIGRAGRGWEQLRHRLLRRAIGQVLQEHR